jgi:hypothetical protein
MGTSWCRKADTNIRKPPENIMKVFPEWTGVKMWSNLSPTQQVSLIVTAASALIALVVYFLYGAGPGVYYSLVAGTTLALLYDRLTRYNFENETVKQLIDAKLSEQDLHYIGNSFDGIKWFCEHHVGAKAVLNTVYRPTGIETGGDMSDAYLKYENAIRKCLDDKCVWYDLAMPGHEDSMIQFRNKLSSRQLMNYGPHVFKPEGRFQIPIFQMTVLKYDTHKAVSFGWAFPHSRGDSKVFVSTDERTVDYFDTYFRALMVHAESLAPALPSAPSRPGSGEQSVAAPDRPNV